MKIEGGKVYLPKVGWVKAKGLRPEFVGEIKTVTVSMEAYQYHASILVELEAEPIRLDRKKVGLDVGVVNIVTDSDGNRTKPIDFERELVKLRRRHQELSRKMKGSKNREKAKRRLSRQNLRIAEMRRDFLHKLSRRYSENQVIVEDLNVKNMTKSAKGTEEKPGRNVKAKSGLNRSILKNGWGMLFVMLAYKTGGNLFKVPPEYTSQKCNACKHISKNNRKSQSRFECDKCGYKDHADVNAAKNIREISRLTVGHTAAMLPSKRPFRAVEEESPAFRRGECQTSQTCSVCGYMSNENREAQSNAYYNASINILNAAGSAVKAF